MQYFVAANRLLDHVAAVGFARERDTLRIVCDQHGAPTWSRDLASMTAHVVTQIQAHCERIAAETATPISDFTGIYHATATGETTWADFAAEALRQLQAHEPNAKLATVTPISTAEYPTAALRPANSSMSNAEVHALRICNLLHAGV